MVIRSAPKLTYEDYVTLPDDRRWEVIDGVAYMVPAPSFDHQDALGTLHVIIRTYLDEHGGGHALLAPFDTVLSDFDVVQPDIVFVSDDDMDVLTRKNIRGTPTWVIEIMSDPYRERGKLARYEAAGVPEHWLADPDERRIDVSLLRRGSYGEPRVYRHPETVTPQILPGLGVDLARVFPKPPLRRL